jgi:hypothetical protein
VIVANAERRDTVARNASETRKRTARTPPEIKKAREYFGEHNKLRRPPIHRAAYSDRMAWVLASMAHLAYDRFEDEHTSHRLFVAKLEGGGFKLIKTFYSKETDTQAFLAESKDG